MRVLIPVHYFLPRHQAGTEVYTAHLARGLAQENEVFILASEDSAAAGVQARDETFEGLPVRRLYHGGPRDFLSTYSDTELDKIFGEYLDLVKPDIIHFQHLFRLSLGLVREAKRRRIPMVLTLADYWFICPPILLLRPGYELCPGPDQGKRCIACGNAIGRFYAGDVSSFSSGFDRALEALVQAGHALKRRLPRPWVERIRRWREEREMKNPESARRIRGELLGTRFLAMQEALGDIDLLLAPSKFLREKYIEAGVVGRERIVHSDYGFEASAFQGLSHSAASRIRFGFIGTPVEHKGLHVLIEAMNYLSDTEASLEVYGDLSWFPAYARRLKRISRNSRTRFRGRFDNQDAARILSSLDVLVVPSLWYENSPLTIHEAYLAGVPVIASNIGGMAELVPDNVSGLQFQVGDPADLARVMRRMITENGLLVKLRGGIPRVKTIDENVSELTKIYRSLC